MTDTDADPETDAGRTERECSVASSHPSDAADQRRSEPDSDAVPSERSDGRDAGRDTGRDTGHYAGRATPTPQRSLEPADAVTANTSAASSGIAGRLERRDYLKAVGAAGAIGSLAGSTTGTVTAQEDWEAAAEERIEEHRTGEVEVVVEDENGTPVPDAEVEIEMQRHDYGFGVAIHSEFLTRGTEWGEEIEGLDEDDQAMYRETIEELFNEVVLENLHKWYLWEDNTEIADDAVDWALERDMDVRGHTCLWGSVVNWAIPPDVVEAMGAEWEDGPDEYDGPDYDPEYVEAESMAHLEEIIEYYGDDVKEWDVVNEVLHATQMIEAIEGDGVDPATAPIVGDWYERAEELAGQYDVGIAVNDFNTLNGPIGNTRDDYERQIQYLVEERGVDLDGIGFQGHFRARTGVLSPEDIMEAVDRYSGYGAGLRVTEFDMFQGDWSDEEQGEYLHQFLKTFFSHPNTDDFLVWGHWTPLHWGDDYGGEEPNAPFYREDWSEKPALESYRNLVFDEWWTEESGTTDADGIYSTTAFLGEHEITVTTNGETVTITESVTDPEGTTVVEVSGNEQPEGECEAADVADSTTLTNGDTVCDVDGDGHYRDVNADGSVSNGDITDFFSNQHVDPWDSRPDLFDFDGDDDVGQGDVVELFHYVN